MRISDWSSDVCSSDLPGRFPGGVATGRRMSEEIDVEGAVGPGADGFHHGAGACRIGRAYGNGAERPGIGDGSRHGGRGDAGPGRLDAGQTGRAPGRASVCQYGSITVGAVSFKTKTQTP